MSVNYRNEILAQLAETYYKFLTLLDYYDEYFMVGIKEGKSKFLSNLNIYLACKNILNSKNNKYYTTDFVTEKALHQLMKEDHKHLIYEHIIPKQRFIQSICENLASKGELKQEFVFNQLNKYLWTATVTKAEDYLLSRTKMPNVWDTSNLLSRYEAANITLIEHDKSYLLN
ncbi:hypothetical protein [Facklamia sp. P12950]|uniref:hypothetical protein n=1 Tax=Facklamia sp. P12950 TaxID=3421951 RepID=UPI003D16778C